MSPLPATAPATARRPLGPTTICRIGWRPECSHLSRRMSPVGTLYRRHRVRAHDPRLWLGSRFAPGHNSLTLWTARMEVIRSGQFPYLDWTPLVDAPACGWSTYSITSSARCCKNKGTSMPIAFAVFRLITNSNFVGCSTGRSAGLIP
jgi:hypothetical protein